MQGPHQLAQKFRTSSLPPKLSRVTVLPLSVITLNSGAVSPALVILGSSVPETTKTKPPASNTMASEIVRFRFHFTLLFYWMMKIWTMRTIVFVGAAMLACGQATAWREAERIFHGDPQWLGSDGAFSIDLGNGRVLWSFGDTLVARKRSDTRENAAFVRNTVAIMTGYDPTTAQ